MVIIALLSFVVEAEVVVITMVIVVLILVAADIFALGEIILTSRKNEIILIIIVF